MNDCPRKPDWTYVDQGWNGWDDFLGKEFWSFERAREFVRSLGLKGIQQWRDYTKTAERQKEIPVAPDQVYSNFDGWHDWMGYRDTKYYWSAEDAEFLSNNKDKPIKWLSEQLNKSEISIRNKRSKMGVVKEAGRAWSKAEDEMLLNNPDKSMDEIVRLLNRSSSSVAGRRAKLKVGKTKRVLKEVDFQFIENHKDEPTEYLARQLGCSNHSIVRAKKKFGGKLGFSQWTEDESQFLIANNEYSAEWIAQRLGKTKEAVQARRKRIGLKKGKGTYLKVA